MKTSIVVPDGPTYTFSNQKIEVERVPRDDGLRITQNYWSGGQVNADFDPLVRYTAKLLARIEELEKKE